MQLTLGQKLRKIWLPRARKLGYLALSLFLFILAIQLMKAGAGALVPFLENELEVDNPAKALGFGWLSAYFVLSGSPVAAAALTFFDAGALDRIQAFFMITGSRLGASLIVLLIGFLYTLRGHERRASISMGLLSLTVTGSTYILGLGPGYFLLISGALDFVQLGSGALLSSFIDLVWGPIVDLATLYLPGFLVFLLGLGAILFSFNLFDRGLPRLRLERTGFQEAARLLYRPLPMFLLGLLVTTVSLSVSISLSILVPLSARGFVRRENVIPYIMGANISTFIDTLFAAVLLNNPSAFTVVFVEMVSIALVSLFILSFSFRAYERGILGLAAAIGKSNRNLALFLFLIFICPILLLWV